MNIHDRLKYLREKLGLTTRAFGSAINMSGGSITNMEKGTRNITERTIRDICREYNVNPDWIINGTDPIFTDMFNDLNIDDEIKQLSQQYSLLNDDDRDLVKRMINSLAEKNNSVNSKRIYEVNNDDTFDIEAELSSYRRELELEKTAKEKSEASPDSKEA
ncbi:MAG: helix-turn-helix domain-containing protein [Butyricicoccus sp.]